MEDIFREIRPYNDSELQSALCRIVSDKRIEGISSYLFNGKADTLSRLLEGVRTVDSLQKQVMIPVIERILQCTTDGLECDGTDYFNDGKCFTLVSVHRDIALDPSFIHFCMLRSNLPGIEVTAGTNLLSDGTIEDMMRSNRMIKVLRTTNARDTYSASVTLSQYIRSRVAAATDPSSVWISQRNGRTKDGRDSTEQGVLKMLSMSGSSDFVDNFEELSIMPVAISYEYEPCLYMKATETLARENNGGTYVKKPGEDQASIIYGIRQRKGRVHISFCRPVDRKELEECAALNHNERYRHLAGIIDSRIRQNYRIWPSNVVASEVLAGVSPSDTAAYASLSEFMDGEVAEFLKRGGYDSPDLRKRMLEILAAPVVMTENQ